MNMSEQLMQKGFKEKVRKIKLTFSKLKLLYIKNHYC